MLRKVVVCFGLVLCLVATALADYSVSDRGQWPASWPNELEPLRAQARTLVGPLAENQHFGIRFTKREDFEAAWPYLLKVKSKQTAIVLVRGENFFLGDGVKAGVVVHTPPAGQQDEEKPIESTNFRTSYLRMTYLEVVVDGEIVDLNRVQLPPDTLILDERFKQ